MTKIGFGIRAKEAEMPGLGQGGPAYRRRRAPTIAEVGHYEPSPVQRVMVMVKAVGGSVVYKGESALPDPVRDDDFEAVELTPTIAQALRDGDLVKPAVGEGKITTATGRQVDGSKPWVDLMPDEVTRIKRGHHMVHVKEREANPMPKIAEVTPSPRQQPAAPPQRATPRRGVPPAE